MAWIAVGYILLSKGFLGAGPAVCLCSQPRFPSPGFQTSLPTPASQWLWLGGEQHCRGAVGCRRWGPCGHGDTLEPLLAAGVDELGFVFALCSLPFGHRLSMGVGSRRDWRGGDDDSVQRASALCCGVISTHLFSLIFFFLSFLLLLFFMFPPCRQFSPPTPGPPFPCDKPET